MEVDQPRASDNVHRIRTRIELGEHSITNVSLVSSMQVIIGMNEDH